MNFRKILITCIALVVFFAQNITANAATYNLHYTNGAPTTDNVLAKTVSLTSTGKAYITVNSQKYTQYISGSYMSAVGVKYPTVQSNIDTTGTFNLNYNGTTIPKKNVNVTAKLTLHNYVNSVNVSSKGSVSA